jgi:hypothetical protein
MLVQYGTAPFSSGGPIPSGKKGFLENVKLEVRAFLCGDKKYKEEHEGLFGKAGARRSFAASTIAVAIASYLTVAPTVIAPIVALTLAGICKGVLNAWCATHPPNK